MVSSCLSCIDKAVASLEKSGKGKASDIAAIGESAPLASARLTVAGITNQRETTVVWSRKTGKALTDAIAWPDTRTTHTVRQLAGKSDKGADALKHITGLYVGCGREITLTVTQAALYLLRRRQAAMAARQQRGGPQSAR